MEATNFKIAELSKKLQELVKKTYIILEQTDNKELKETLDKELYDLNKRADLKIAFVGQYSSGKSTIISALTGKKDIKIDANVATDCISEYRWNNVILMDTPGILAGKVEHHDEQTKKALKECDLIVYVLTSQLFDDVIFENFIDLAYTQKLNDKMLIAINKMSMEAGDFEFLKQNYLKSIQSIFKERDYDFNFEVVFIDAADYIEGKDELDDEFIQLSHFNSFISTLNTFVEKKGLIKKQFDTPVRILKSCVADIALSQVDPNLMKQAEFLSTRIIKSMNNMERSLALSLNEFESECISESMRVSSQLGHTDELTLKNEVDNLNRTIENKTNALLDRLEDDTIQNYNELMSDMDNFGNKESLLSFKNNLESKIKSPSISLDEKNNLENQKKFLDFLTTGAPKVSQMAGVESLKGIAQSSGSQLHKSIYDIGKFFGHKFEPWGAVKIASNIGKFAKFGIPVLTTAALIGFAIYEDKQEKKRIKQIDAAKNQLNADLRSEIKTIRRSIEEDFKNSVIKNYKEKLQEVNQIKFEFANKISKNENMKKYLKDLDAEYVDFIEIIQ